MNCGREVNDGVPGRLRRGAEAPELLRVMIDVARDGSEGSRPRALSCRCGLTSYLATSASRSGFPFAQQG